MSNLGVDAKILTAAQLTVSLSLHPIISSTVNQRIRAIACESKLLLVVGRNLSAPD